MKDDWKKRLDALEAKLSPIANRPMDLSELKHAREIPQAIDQAGVREEAESMVTELIEAYEKGDAIGRASLRSLLAAHPSFAWAAQPAADSSTVEGFRTILLWASLLDQGSDTRDLLVTLDYECAKARAAGIDVRPIVQEVAILSSDIDRYGMGSTRHILMRRVR